MAREQIETWYKGGRAITIDVNSPIQVKSFTKKGYGPKKDQKPKVEEVKKSTPSKRGY